MGATLRIILFAWILLLGGLPDSFAHIPAKITTRSLPQAIRGEVESGASLTFKPTASVQRYTRDTTDYYKASITRPIASTNQFIYVTNTASLPPMMDLPAVSATNVTAVYIPVSNTFLYDNAGNTTNDGYWDYTWDGYNRLTKVESKANAPIASRRSIVFKYDAGGRRIARVTGAADANGVYRETDSRKFVYNGWKLVAELNGTNNAVIRSYLWAGNQLLAINQNNVQYLPTFDGQGNVMSLIQADNKAVVARYDYSPFGILLKASGPMALENPIRFSSEYQDDVTGFIYYGYRYYNPTTQTWLSRDPIGMAGGFNLYALVDNDPVNGRDYLGLDALSWVCGQGWSGEAADEFEVSMGESVLEHWDAISAFVEQARQDGFWETRERLINQMADRYTDVMVNYDESTMYLVAANDLTGGTLFMEGSTGMDIRYQTELTDEEGRQRMLMGGGQMLLTTVSSAQSIASARASVQALQAEARIAKSLGAKVKPSSALSQTKVECAPSNPAAKRAGPLPAGEAPYQLKLFPDEAYNRVQHYGRTPTAQQRASVPSGMEFDHNPTLVQHYYEGVNGGLPGFNLTQTERLQHARSLTSGGAATPAQQRAQGAAAAAYSREQKRLWGLE